MNIGRFPRAALLSLFVAASSIAAAPGSGVFLVGDPLSADSASQPSSFELLGGWASGKWLAHESLKVNPVEYTLWNFAGAAGRVTGGTKVSFQEPCPDTFSVDVKPAPNRADWWIAVNAPWNPRPRTVTVLPNSSAVYQGVVRDFLIGKGLKNPKVKLDRVVKTDLEGDGQDEVIIAATNFKNGSSLVPPSGGAAGDYGLLLMRKIVNGKPETIALGADVFLTPTTIEQVEKGTQNNPDTFALVNVLDLNGDGKMEIIMYNAIYEDYGVFVMEWDGKIFKQRLVTGCGV
jgi:hypothetical protein